PPVEPPREKRGGGPPPVRPRTPGGGGASLPRLALLIGAAIVLAVLLVFWVNSCREGGKQGTYRDYLQDVGTVVQASQRVGAQLTDALTTPGVTLEDLESALDGLARQQAQVVTRADELAPPGPLVEEQESLVESMQLLANGLVGLKEAVSQIQLASDPEEAGASLAGQAGRLVAGQVVYDDLFRARSQQVMQSEEVSGVPVPELVFLSSPELIGQGSLTELIARLTQGGGGGGGGLHGNQIDGVVVKPGDQPLSPDEENQIVATDRLAIQVLVTNSGDFQETQVRVTLTIQQSPQPINKEATIDVINKGQTKTVTFRDFSNVTFAARTNLQVAISPVDGETNTANNTAEYPVIFTLE
ncbi:MAG: hypothetical protein WD670_04610, partial [Actinomycetota bacterium]